MTKRNRTKHSPDFKAKAAYVDLSDEGAGEQPDAAAGASPPAIGKRALYAACAFAHRRRS